MHKQRDGGLRGLFTTHLKSWQVTPIESGHTVLGIPDVELCAPGGATCWVETKQCDGNAVRVRAGQVSWIGRRARLGGRVFVAVRRGPELFIFRGHGVKALAEGGLKAAEPWLEGKWDGGPARWDWASIEGIFSGAVE